MYRFAVLIYFATIFHCAANSSANARASDRFTKFVVGFFYFIDMHGKAQQDWCPKDVCELKVQHIRHTNANMVLDCIACTIYDMNIGAKGAHEFHLQLTHFIDVCDSSDSRMYVCASVTRSRHAEQAPAT